MNEVLDYLLSLAFDKGIGVIETRELTSHIPSFSIPEKRIIMLNLNWHNQREIPLILAHEIGHILHDTETSTNTFTSHIKCEGGADTYAISLLVQYYYEYILESRLTLLNIETFVTMFAVPSRDRWKVAKIFEDKFK